MNSNSKNDPPKIIPGNIYYCINPKSIKNKLGEELHHGARNPKKAQKKITDRNQRLALVTYEKDKDLGSDTDGIQWWEVRYRKLRRYWKDQRYPEYLKKTYKLSERMIDVNPKKPGPVNEEQFGITPRRNESENKSRWEYNGHCKLERIDPTEAAIQLGTQTIENNKKELSYLNDSTKQTYTKILYEYEEREKNYQTKIGKLEADKIVLEEKYENSEARYESELNEKVSELTKELNDSYEKKIATYKQQTENDMEAEKRKYHDLEVENKVLKAELKKYKSKNRRLSEIFNEI